MMTAEELRSWVKERQLSEEEAAAMLGFSVQSLRNRLAGAVPVGEQTAIIIDLYRRLHRARQRLPPWQRP